MMATDESHDTNQTKYIPGSGADAVKMWSSWQ
jgi:hypothetical protein